MQSTTDFSTSPFDCITCLRRYASEGDESYPYLLPCLHSFCGRCVKRLQDHDHKKCPLCRTPIGNKKATLNLLAKDMAELTIEKTPVTSKIPRDLSTYCIDLSHRKLTRFAAECSNEHAKTIFDISDFSRISDVYTAKMLVKSLLEKHSSPELVLDNLLETIKRKRDYEEFSYLEKILTSDLCNNNGNYHSLPINFHDHQLTPALLVLSEELTPSQLTTLSILFTINSKKSFAILRELACYGITVAKLLEIIKGHFEENELTAFKAMVTDSSTPTSTASGLTETIYPGNTEETTHWPLDDSIKQLSNSPLAKARELGQAEKRIIDHIEHQISLYWHEFPEYHEQFKAIFIPGLGDSDNIHTPADFINQTNLTLAAFRKRCLDNSPFFHSFLYAASGHADKPLPDDVELIPLCEFFDRSNNINPLAFSTILSDLCAALEQDPGIELNVQFMSCKYLINMIHTDSRDIGHICSVFKHRGVTIGGLFQAIKGVFKSSYCDTALSSFRDSIHNLYQQIKNQQQHSAVPTPNKILKLDSDTATSIKKEPADVRSTSPVSGNTVIDFSKPAIIRALQAFCCDATQEQLKRLIRRYNFVHHDLKDKELYCPFLFLRQMAKDQITVNNLLDSINTIFENEAFTAFKAKTTISTSDSDNDQNRVHKYKTWFHVSHQSTDSFKSKDNPFLAYSFRKVIDDMFYYPNFHRQYLKTVVVTDDKWADIKSHSDFRAYLVRSGLTMEEFLLKCKHHQPYFNIIPYTVLCNSDGERPKLTEHVSETAVCELKTRDTNLEFNSLLVNLRRKLGFNLNDLHAISKGLGLNYYSTKKNLFELINNYCSWTGVTVGALFKVLDSVALNNNQKQAVSKFKKGITELHEKFKKQESH